MIDFSTTKKLTIPEGTVKRITDANGIVIWVNTQIQFEIDFNGRRVTYTATDGMTWSEWCDSVYNTGGYSIASNEVSRGGGAIVIMNEKPDNAIVDGRTYNETMEF